MNGIEGRPSSAAGWGGETPASEGRVSDGRGVDDTGDGSGSQLMLPLSRGIHAMRAVQAAEVNECKPGSAEGADTSLDLRDHTEAPLGQRLRAARESQGLSQADVAARLKLPVKLIGRLENDDYEGLTQGVFLHGYLASYARLAGLPVEQAARVASANTEAAPLVATGTISRSRYLLDRYSVSATYLVLTAIIVVPAVWLATHGGLEQNLARTTTLDPPAQHVSADGRVNQSLPNPAASTVSAQGATDRSAGLVVSTVPPPSLHVDPPPVVASMTPFAAPAGPQPAAQATPTNASAATGEGRHALSLKLARQSWVEVTTADGRKLEYSMLDAGSEHEYRSDGPITVRLGNVQGAELRTDGSLIDLAPFQRGNVVHVKLFGEAGVSRVNQ
jgi:cytoskeleton protein RodZ